MEVCIGVCIGWVKHARFHEFLTRHFWKQPRTILTYKRDPYVKCQASHHEANIEVTHMGFATPILLSTTTRFPVKRFSRVDV